MYMETKNRPLFIVDEIRSQAANAEGSNPVHEMERTLQQTYRRAAP